MIDLEHECPDVDSLVLAVPDEADSFSSSVRS